MKAMLKSVLECPQSTSSGSTSAVDTTSQDEESSREAPAKNSLDSASSKVNPSPSTQQEEVVFVAPRLPETAVAKDTKILARGGRRHKPMIANVKVRKCKSIEQIMIILN